MPDDIAWWNKGTGMMSTVFGSTAAEVSVIRTRQRAACRRQRPRWSCVSGQNTDPQWNDFACLVPPECWNEPEVVLSDYLRSSQVPACARVCLKMCMMFFFFFLNMLISHSFMFEHAGCISVAAVVLGQVEAFSFSCYQRLVLYLLFLLQGEKN